MILLLRVILCLLLRLWWSNYFFCGGSCSCLFNFLRLVLSGLILSRLLSLSRSRLNNFLSLSSSYLTYLFVSVWILFNNLFLLGCGYNLLNWILVNSQRLLLIVLSLVSLALIVLLRNRDLPILLALIVMSALILLWLIICTWIILNLLLRLLLGLLVLWDSLLFSNVYDYFLVDLILWDITIKSFRLTLVLEFIFISFVCSLNIFSLMVYIIWIIIIIFTFVIIIEWLFSINIRINLLLNYFINFSLFSNLINDSLWLLCLLRNCYLVYNPLRLTLLLNNMNICVLNRMSFSMYSSTLIYNFFQNLIGSLSSLRISFCETIHQLA